MTSLVRLRLDIGYDGTDFAGWARQPEQRTVQGTVEDALARVLRLDPPPVLTVAGRTDAGVHARGQVAHVVLPAGAYGVVNGTLPRRLAGVLPPDVRVWRVSLAPEGFDARFSALSRRYVYRVCDDPVGVEPLRRRDVLWHPRPLNLDRMNAATALLVGEFDFAAYCRRREGATTIRRLLRYDWAREEGRIAAATVEADAFCHSMVRALVGALLVVGDGRRPVDWPAEVLAARVRDSAVNVAPAHGLSLEEIRYPDDAGLARRAQETRRVRTLSAPSLSPSPSPSPSLSPSPSPLSPSSPDPRPQPQPSPRPQPDAPSQRTAPGPPRQDPAASPLQEGAQPSPPAQSPHTQRACRIR